MEMSQRIAAGEFKAKCLALLDDVATSGREIVVTKRGRPVARLVPLVESPRQSMEGSVAYRRERDLLDPVDEGWDADR
jgi:prevent-host-death family protein